MAANPVLQDATTYTSATHSVDSRIAASLAQLGKSNVFHDYGEQELESYFGPIPIINFVKTNDWLMDKTSVEDGDDSATWDRGEYAVGNLAEVAEGYTTTSTPVNINSNVVWSLKERTRLRNRSDLEFDAHVTAKTKKAVRDIKNTIISRFLTEVLNKSTPAVAGTYLFADGKTLLAPDHAYRNGKTFDNYDGANVFDETAADNARDYSAKAKDSGGIVPLSMSLDTVIVAAGSANEKRAFQLSGVANAMAIASANVTVQGDRNNLFPQSNGQVNVYNGSFRIVSVKGMTEDLWIMCDSTQEAPISFHMNTPIENTTTVPEANDAKVSTFNTWGEFWFHDLPKFVYGGGVL